MFSVAVKKLTRAGTIRSYFPKRTSPERFQSYIWLCTHSLLGHEGRTKNFFLKTERELSLFLVEGINLHPPFYQNSYACRERKRKELLKKLKSEHYITNIKAVSISPLNAAVMFTFGAKGLMLQAISLRTAKQTCITFYLLV